MITDLTLAFKNMKLILPVQVWWRRRVPIIR